MAGRGAVRCMGRLEDAYRACLWSRIGSRVLWEVGKAFVQPVHHTAQTVIHTLQHRRHDWDLQVSEWIGFPAKLLRDVAYCNNAVIFYLSIRICLLVFFLMVCIQMVIH